ERGMAKAVIGGALLSVLQDVVGFADFLETRPTAVVVGIAVGMKFLRELAIGALDLLDRGVLPATQNVVVAALVHGGRQKSEIRILKSEGKGFIQSGPYSGFRLPSSELRLGSALFLFVDFGDLGVADVLVVLGGAGAIGGFAAGARLLLCLVHGLAELHRGLGEGLRFRLDRIDVLTLHR